MTSLANEIRLSRSSCGSCEFELFDIVSVLTVSDLALVNDRRFPGRAILGLREHAEQCDELSPERFQSFALDAQRAARAIREATGCDRVNILLLGNRTSHLHFHLVPRLHSKEPRPDRPPSDDPRPAENLGGDEFLELVERIRSALAGYAGAVS